MDEDKYLVCLYSFIEFGPARTSLLINYFGSAKNAWEANKNELVKIGLRKSTVDDFVDYRNKFNPQKYFEKLKKDSIKFITINNEDYPKNLRGVEDAPLVLYLKGNLSKNDKNAVAIVGSRKMTSYGRDVTYKLSSELASLGITIISGLALGVDSEVHKSALEVSGRCIAVLAGGVDQITPRTNEWLGKKILESGGAIVSEFPVGVFPQKHFFPFRNRIISGLSKAVVIIEGMIGSGTIHTANHAAKQGKQVFAVPGPITSPTSQAPNFLIKNGAKPVTGVNDILEELNLQLKVDLEEIQKTMPSDEFETKLYEIISREPLHIDEIVRISGLGISKVSEKLSFMELKGMIKNIGNKVYKKA